jgi:hypothetical protein
MDDERLPTSVFQTGVSSTSALNTSLGYESAAEAQVESAVSPSAAVSTASVTHDDDDGDGDLLDNMYTLPNFSSDEEASTAAAAVVIDEDEPIVILDSDDDDDVPIKWPIDVRGRKMHRRSPVESDSDASKMHLDSDSVAVEFDSDSDGSAVDQPAVVVVPPKVGPPRDLSVRTQISAGFQAERHRPAPKIPAARRRGVAQAPSRSLPRHPVTFDDDEAFGFSIIEDAPRRLVGADGLRLQGNQNRSSPIPGAAAAKQKAADRSSPAPTQFARQLLLTKVLSIKAEDLERPISNTMSLPPLPTKFKNITEYQELYCHLLAEECRAMLEAEWAAVNPANTKECRVDRVTRVRGVLQLDLVSSERLDFTLSTDTVVVVHTTNGPIAKVLAIVKESAARGGGTRVLLKALMQEVVGGIAPFSTRVKIGHTVAVLPVSNIRSVVRQVEAVGAIGTNSLHEYLLGHGPATNAGAASTTAASASADRMNLLQPTSPWEAVRDDLRGRLNESQVEAVASCLTDSNRLVAVQGPPGTGKSTTLISLVIAILRGANEVVVTSNTGSSRSLSSGSNPRSRLKEVSLAGGKVGSKSRRRLLVCAPSNAAIDELVRRFGRAGARTDAGPLRCVRVGHHPHASVEQWSLKRLIQVRLENIAKLLKGKHKMLQQGRSDVSETKKHLAELGRQVTEAAKFSNIPGCGDDIRTQISHLKMQREDKARELTQCEVSVKRLSADVSAIQKRLSRGEQEVKHKVSVGIRRGIFLLFPCDTLGGEGTLFSHDAHSTTTCVMTIL